MNLMWSVEPSVHQDQFILQPPGRHSSIIGFAWAHRFLEKRGFQLFFQRQTQWRAAAPAGWRRTTFNVKLESCRIFKRSYRDPGEKEVQIMWKGVHLYIGFFAWRRDQGVLVQEGFSNGKTAHNAGQAWSMRENTTTEGRGFWLWG